MYGLLSGTSQRRLLCKKETREHDQKRKERNSFFFSLSRKYLVYRKDAGCWTHLFFVGLSVVRHFVVGLFVVGLFVVGLFVVGLFVAGLFVVGLFVVGLFVYTRVFY